MRILPSALLATALIATTAPAASAHPNFHYRGGCEGVWVHQPSATGDAWIGLVSVEVVATEPSPVPGTPDLPTPLAGIDVVCTTEINGVDQGPVSPQSTKGTGVAAAVYRNQYDATPDDIVTLCEVVTIESEQHSKVCRPADVAAVPPAALFDLLDIVRPVLCLVLSILKPGIGPVQIDQDDYDLHVNDRLVYSCSAEKETPLFWVSSTIQLDTVTE